MNILINPNAGPTISRVAEVAKTHILCNIAFNCILCIVSTNKKMFQDQIVIKIIEIEILSAYFYNNESNRPMLMC